MQRLEIPWDKLCFLILDPPVDHVARFDLLLQAQRSLGVGQVTGVVEHEGLVALLDKVVDFLVASSKSPSSDAILCEAKFKVSLGVFSVVLVTGIILL